MYEEDDENTSLQNVNELFKIYHTLYFKHHKNHI